MVCVFFWALDPDCDFFKCWIRIVIFEIMQSTNSQSRNTRNVNSFTTCPRSNWQYKLDSLDVLWILIIKSNVAKIFAESFVILIEERIQVKVLFHQFMVANCEVKFFFLNSVLVEAYFWLPLAGNPYCWSEELEKFCLS